MKTSVSMKDIFLALAIVAGAFAVTAQPPRIYTGIGPIVSASKPASELPSKAKKFITKHFRDVPVSRTEVDFANGDIEVTLANGVELEFTSKGALVEIEAPDNYMLNESVVKAVLPRSTFKDLRERGMSNMVEGIKHDRYGYKVELNDRVYEEARYGEDGQLVAFYEEF